MRRLRPYYLGSVLPITPGVFDESGESSRQLFTCGRASINYHPITKPARLIRRNRPVAQHGKIRINQPLLVRTPARGMVRIARMIEGGNAKCLVAEGPLDVAPRRTLLLTVASLESVGIQV